MPETDLGTSGTFSDVDMDFSITGTPPGDQDCDCHGTDGGSTSEVADISGVSGGNTAPNDPSQASVNDTFAAAQVSPYTYDAFVATQNMRDKGFDVTLGQMLFLIQFYGYGWTTPSHPEILAIVQSVPWQNALRASNLAARSGFELHDIIGYARRFGL